MSVPLGRRELALFGVVSLFSIAAKIWLAGLGHNFDLESWSIFADLIEGGKNVYAETYRNPYGPVWAYLCAFARYVQTELFGASSIESFHRILASFLSLVDVAIAALLWRRFSFAAGIVFLANPVSLLITGFHTQFGNLAVFLALVACALLDDENEDRRLRFVSAMLLLGLSLATKHILIFLPLWLVLRPNASRQKRFALLAPYAVFALGFVPFVLDERGLEGVIEHVFLYQGFHLDAFFPYLVNAVVPVAFIEAFFAWVPVFSGFKLLFVSAMMVTGFVVRAKSHLEQALVYLVAMVVFSSASADQYLAIPLAACAVYWKRWTVWWYMAMSTIYLCSSQANVGMLESMVRYSETVRELGLERWHPVAALAVFLLVYGLHRSASSASQMSTSEKAKASQP